jgi:phosphatidylserine/phosphatidylglycerophosphate/cardiolipin synthase-like enzyme
MIEFDKIMLGIIVVIAILFAAFILFSFHVTNTTTKISVYTVGGVIFLMVPIFLLYSYINRTIKVYKCRRSSLTAPTNTNTVSTKKQTKLPITILDNFDQSWHTKLELIQKAERHIIFITKLDSMGEEDHKLFHVVIEAIEEQISLKLSLVAVLVIDDSSLSSEDKNWMIETKRKYGDRFIWISTAVWYDFERATVIHNHIKLILIDDGKEFVTGGACLQSIYNENNKTFEEKKLKKCNNDSLLGNHLMDMDFHIRDASCGSILFKQIKKWMIEWKKKFPHNENVTFNEEFMGDSVKTIDFTMEDMDVHIISPYYFPSSPSDELMRINEWRNTIFHHIKFSLSRIFIAHMFIHMDDELQMQLLRAAQRGLEITIITNSLIYNCPTSHYLFVPRSRKNYSPLLQFNNVNIYEWNEPYTTYHTKVIIVDDSVLLGNSNLGDKSLLFHADYEINLCIKDNNSFSDEVIEKLRKHIPYCVRMTSTNKSQDNSIFLNESIASHFHEDVLGQYIG